MSQYATRAQFDVYGLPSTVTSGRPDSTIDPFLVAASSLADSSLRAVGALPISAPYPLSLVQAVCQIASPEVLMRVVGFNPEQGEDNVFLESAKVARAWLKEVAAGNVEISDLVDATPALIEDAPEVFSDESRGI